MTRAVVMPLMACAALTMVVMSSQFRAVHCKDNAYGKMSVADEEFDEEVEEIVIAERELNRRDDVASELSSKKLLIQFCHS